MKQCFFFLLVAFSSLGFGHVLHRLRDDPVFVGRMHELQLVREGLQQHKRLAIVGAAGIGKTSLALEYVRRSQNDYDAIFWLDPKGNISASLKQLATHLDVPTGQCSLSMIVDSIKHQLDITRSRFLLVFDSMPDDPLQLSFLPAPGARSPCHVLITSRSNKLSQEEFSVELGPLQRCDSAELLKRSSNEVCSDLAKGERIAELLEDFPLALRQAGACLAQSGESPDSFIERLIQFEQNNSSSTLFAKSLAAVGFLSMQEIQKKCPIAKQVLQISSLINGNDIPISLMDKMLHPKGVLDETLAILSAYALIALEEETFTIHRCFQQMVLSHLTQKESAKYLRDALHFFNYHFNYSREQVHKDKHLEEIYPHLTALLERPQTENLEPALTARMLGKIGCYELWEHDAYHTALDHLQKALQIQESLAENNVSEWPVSFGETTRMRSECAALHFAIGTALQHLNQHLDAKRHFEVSLDFFQQIEEARRAAHRPSRFGQAIASNWHGLARVAYDTGDFALSKTLFKKALAVNKAFYNTEERFFIARDIHWLGCLCVWDGDFNQAIDLLKRSLEISCQVFSTDLPPYSGDTLCELGKIYMHLGHFDLSHNYLEQAMRSEEKYHGAVGSPHGARAHHLLARHYLYLGAFDLADKHLHEALLMRMILYGSEKHPKVIDTLRLLGELCLEKGDWRLARTYLEKVYRINQEVSIGSCCEDITETLVSLGDCATLRSDLNEAKIFYEEALKSQCSARYLSTPRLSVGIELMLGQIHYELGNYSESLYYLNRAKKNANSLFATDNHLHIAHADRALGKIAVQQTEYKKAGRYYAKALETYRSLYKRDAHPYIGELLIEIAELNYKLGDYEEAFDLCEQARKINDTVFNDKKNLFLADILNWQGRICYRKGKFDQALELLSRAQEIANFHFPDRSAVCRATTNHFLADVLWSLGRYDEAYSAGYSSCEEFQTIYNKPAHSNLIDSKITLAKVCIDLKKYSEAEELLTGTLKVVNSLNPKSIDHRKSHTYFWLGSLEQALGHYKQAEVFFRKEYYILSAIHQSNPNHPYIGMAYLKLADCLIHQNNRDAARYYYQKALDVQKTSGFVFKHQSFSEQVNHIQENL